MITNYSYPQSEVYQVLETTANPLLDRIHAVVVGPAYIHADALAGNLDYQTYQQDAVVPFTLLADGQTVTKGLELLDESAVNLLAKGLRLNLFTEVTPRFSPLASDPTGNVLQYITGSFYDAYDPDVAEEFDYGRPPTPGDIYQITDGTLTIERKVVALLGQDIDPALDFSSYFGAQPWSLSTAAENTVTEQSANFTYTALLPDGSALTAPAERYVRRFGRPNLADNGGLRLVAVVNCLEGGSDPTFTATINGAPVAIVAVPGATTTFTLADDIIFSVTDYPNWLTGDRLTAALDYADTDVINPDASTFDASWDLTGYTFAEATRRTASAITLEVIGISNTDVITFRVSDTGGLMIPTTFVLDSGATLGLDLTFDGATINLGEPAGWLATGFHIGQKFVYQVTPPTRSNTIFDKVQLNASLGGSLNPTALLVDAFTPYSGPVDAVEPVSQVVNYTVAEDSVTLETLSVAVDGYSLPGNSVKTAVDGIGTVALEWRAAISVGDSDGLVAIDSVEDIVTNYGSTALGSELGYGLLKAFNGSQGKRVYALNTGGPEYSRFVDAFAKLEASNYVYSIGVLTEDEDVMKLAASHVQEMSMPTVKKFRRAYVGTDSPGEYPILDLQADGSPYSASVEQGIGGLYNSVVFQDEVIFAAHTFTRGDFLEIVGSGERYLIDEVNEISLPGGVDSIAINLQEDVGFPAVSTTVRVIAADTAENTGRYVWQRSERLGSGVEQDRRISNIWQHNGTADSVVIPNRFGACEMAGLRSALQPQQGLTRTEVTFIDSSPAMYTKFRQSVLDNMAANGVWIIAQNSAEGPCYVRHQLTTAVSNGSLYYEDNVGVNVDTICFAADDIADPLIGKRNATPRTVLEIRNKLATMLTALTKEPYDSEIGPQIISFFNSNGDTDSLDVEIDANFKDRINAGFGVEIPLPLNNVRIYVKARTIKNDGLTVNSISISVL